MNGSACITGMDENLSKMKAHIVSVALKRFFNKQLTLCSSASFIERLAQSEDISDDV